MISLSERIDTLVWDQVARDVSGRISENCPEKVVAMSGDVSDIVDAVRRFSLIEARLLRPRSFLRPRT